MTQVSTFSSALAAAIGSIVLRTTKDGETSRFKIAGADAKLGKLKDGTEAAYMLLKNETDDTVTILVHPKTAERLLAKGADSSMVLEGFKAAEPEVNAEKAAEPEVTPAVKEPSKKDRTIAVFQSMSGKPRKEVIAALKTDIGLSQACANTYYQLCKSGKWGTAPVAAAPAAQSGEVVNDAAASSTDAQAVADGVQTLADSAQALANDAQAVADAAH